MAEESLYTLYEPYRPIYEAVAKALDGLAASDELQLKDIWESNEERLRQLKAAPMFFNGLLAKKEYLKKLCAEGGLEEYRSIDAAARLKYGKKV